MPTAQWKVQELAGAMLPTAQGSSRGHVAEELLLQMFQQRLCAMLPLRVKFMEEGHVAHFPMDSACMGWCHVAQFIKKLQGHAFQRGLACSMFQTYGDVDVRVIVAISAQG